MIGPYFCTQRQALQLPLGGRSQWHSLVAGTSSPRDASGTDAKHCLKSHLPRHCRCDCGAAFTASLYKQQTKAQAASQNDEESKKALLYNVMPAAPAGVTVGAAFTASLYKQQTQAGQAASRKVRTSEKVMCESAAGVIVGAAFTASLYKQQTKAVERSNSDALARMSSVAAQAFSGIRTVRWVVPDG